MKRWIARLQIVVPALFLLDIAVNLLARFPDNHGSGFEYLYRPFYWSWGAILLVGLPFRKIDLRGLACGFAVLAMFFFSDKYNLYLEYEEWLCRGMPEWGTSDRGWRSLNADIAKSLQEEEAHEAADEARIEITLNHCSDFFSHDREYPVFVQRNDRPEIAKSFPKRLFGNLDDTAERQCVVRMVAAAFDASCWMNEKFAVLGYELRNGRIVPDGEVQLQECPELRMDIPSVNCTGTRLSDVASFLDDCLGERLGETRRTVRCDANVSDVPVSFYPDAPLVLGDWLDLLTKLCPIDVLVEKESIRFVPADDARSAPASPEGADTPQTGASEAQPPAPHSIPTSP